MNHPNVHQPWSAWSEEQTLHVACCYSNPFRWRTRRELLNNFRKVMEAQPNVCLHVGELAYGDRPFEITSPDNPLDVQFRTTHELFHKENVQREVIKHFPVGWKYGATFDADFHLTRYDWALETIHQLQHYDFVQCFSSYVDVSGSVYGQAHAPTRYNSSFFFNYIQNGYKVSEVYHNHKISTGKKDSEGYEETMLQRGVGATGGALAFTHTAYDMVGGLLHRCILGHADWYMAFSLVGVEPPDIHSQKYNPSYQKYVLDWQEKAKRIRKRVGYIDGMAVHFFHGSKTRRAYSSRDVILAKHKFDPYTDVYEDSQGILQLNPDKIELRDDIRHYFISRFEDDPNLYGSEKLLV